VIIHLFEFRVVPGHEAEVTGFLRHSLLDGAPPEGMITAYVGRRLGRQQLEHIVATNWRDEAAYGHGTDPRGVPVHISAKADLFDERRSAAFRVAASTGRGWEGARILRVYRASIAAESVPAWEQRAMEPVTSLSIKDGLLSALAGVRLPSVASSGRVSVIAVSAWRDWVAVLAATGGHIDRLVQETELTDLEQPVAVDHYQLLTPDAGTAAD
jgi:hypothetical protein